MAKVKQYVVTIKQITDVGEHTKQVLATAKNLEEAREISERKLDEVRAVLKKLIAKGMGMIFENIKFEILNIEELSAASIKEGHPRTREELAADQLIQRMEKLVNRQVMQLRALLTEHEQAQHTGDEHGNCETLRIAAAFLFLTGLGLGEPALLQKVIERVLEANGTNMVGVLVDALRKGYLGAVGIAEVKDEKDEKLEDIDKFFDENTVIH